MGNSVFKNFDLCRINELQVIRDGFFSPKYVLADGQFYYGRLSRAGALRREMIVETADGAWMIKQQSLFGRETNIINVANNEIIGKITRQRWGNKVNIEMADGFKALFYKEGLFSRIYKWVDDQHGDFIKIKGLFKYATPFLVTFDQISLNRTKLNPPLVMLIGVHIILLRHAQAAAH